MTGAEGFCAGCGLPGHRYGRNEGPERYSPIACINSLRALLAEARDFFVRGDYETTDRGRWERFMEVTRDF